MALRSLVKKVIQDRLATESAALSFFMIFSIAPLLLLLLTILATVNPVSHSELVTHIDKWLGPEPAQMAAFLLKRAGEWYDPRFSADLWGLATLVVTSSVVFLHLQNTLNMIFGALPSGSSGWIEEIKNFFLRRLFCFLVASVFVLVSAASIVLSTYVHTMISPWGWWGDLLHTLVALSFSTFTFAVIYHWMPDARVEWMASLRGGMVAAALFLTGKSLLTLYLGRIAMWSIFGAAGAPILFMAWIYYSAMIFLFGAEIASWWRQDAELQKPIFRGLDRWVDRVEGE